MQDTAEHIEEVAEAQAPTAEDVKAFLQEEAEKKEAAEAAEDEQEELKDIKDLDENSEPTFSATFSADVTFEENELEKLTKQYMVPVKDEQVPITDADQAMYLKSVLNDVPLRLEQELAGGMLKIECRALSVYEQDLVVAAALKMSGIASGEDETPMTLSLLPGFAQQIRIVMQTTRVNNVPQEFVQLEAEVKKEDREKQIDYLIKQVYAKMEHMQTSKFGFLVRAVNVFEHKLAKMNTLAYNKTFWTPAEID